MRPLHTAGGGTSDRSASARHHRVVALASALLLGLALLGPTTAGAQSAPPPPPPDDRLSPELATVPIDSSNYQEAVAHLRGVESNLRVAEQAQARADLLLQALAATEGRLSAQVQAAGLEREAAARRVDEIRAGLRELAVEAYIAGGEGAVAQNLDLDVQASLERDRDGALVDTVTDHHRADYRTNVQRRDAAAREVDRDAALLASLHDRTAEATAARDAAAESAALLTLQLGDAQQAVADARLTAQVVGADFPLVALDAFWRAAAKVNALAPGCNVRWTMLAGISRVEGVHGTWGGSSLDGDGNTTRRITGPPLNGENNTAVVRDSDGGLWDDDPVWDRGVGPMGFIPSSWRIFGGDGNGDGQADPHNIYDAAEGSARILCYRSSQLDQEPNLRAALFRYNHSQRYVDIVIGYIHGYDALGYPPPR